ncbi:unnamed protein product [Bursaphelenchus xylophilus]|uniref:(pine wood nematode) hypothetical protein n=1 Tax=Bursaphelenchus xylophilus TaxID=6326 RepID=A0A1I7RLV0_BURXY|nr:unnamed protein product [Bursaphelenchus xylophilus]CAG9106218.1 unnamed protein product [Bursaphelenchus xylophilus]
MSILTPITFVCLISAVFSADLSKDVKEITTTEDGAKWCPVPLAGTQCPASSFFHYYTCCGDLLKECCFNFQTWVLVVLIGIGVLVAASIVLSLIRCLFCRRN